MINKIARILLNSIRTNQPKKRIIRLAKLFNKLAAKEIGLTSGTYHDAMVERFVEKFQNTDNILGVIERYKNNEYPRYSSVIFRKDKNPYFAEKVKNAISSLGTRQISEVTAGIIENDSDIKNYFETAYRDIGVKSVKLRHNNKGYNFDFYPSIHFAYRNYFRGIDTGDLAQVLEDLCNSIIVNYEKVIQYKDHEGKIAITTNAKKYGLPITIVIASLEKRSLLDFRMDLISIYPNEYKRITFPRSKVDPTSTPTTSLSPEQFLSVNILGNETIPFQIWNTGKTYTPENTITGMLEYPKQLERHITLENIAKIAKRIGVAVRNKELGTSIKVQIDCPVCYDLQGNKTDSKIQLVFIVQKESDTKYKITKINSITNNPIESKKVWWKLDTWESIQ